MDQRLPSGQPPDTTPPTAPSGVANVKPTPEKLSHLETKQDSKLETVSLVSRLQQDVVSADGVARRNGDIDVTSDDLIKAKQTPYSQVDSHKETVTSVSKTELDPKKPSSPNKSDSQKITSIQFAELPLDASIPNTRSLRDPEMKSDLQRSSTVPEISLRKEPSEETVTVANIANADIATIASGGSSSLIDWNAENRTLYRNNVEMRSVGNLALHSTIEEEPGQRPDKHEISDGVIESMKTDTRTVSVNGTEALPSKCEVSLSQTASPSHVTVSFPKEVSKPETSASKSEKVPDIIEKSSLTDGPITKPETVPIIGDQTSKSTEKESSVTQLITKEDKTSSGAAEGLKKVQTSDELCQQKGIEVVKDTICKEQPISSTLPHDKKESLDSTKIHLGPDGDLDKDKDKRTLDKTITVSEEIAKKEQVTSGDSLRGIEIEKTIDKTKDDKMFKLEKQTERPSETIAAVDQTKAQSLSSISDVKDQKKGDLVASKKESSLSLAEELKSELPFTAGLDKVDKTKETQEKEVEKLPPSATRDDKLQPQLIADKKKSEPIPTPTVISEQTIVKVPVSEKDGKLNGPLTDSIAQKGEPSIKGAESKQIKDSFNLEQKNSISGLCNDVHKETSISSEEKGIVESKPVKTVSDASAASKEFPLPVAEDMSSSAKRTILQEKLDSKEKESTSTGISVIKAEQTKEKSEIQPQTVINGVAEADSKPKELQKSHDIPKHEPKKDDIQEKSKVTVEKPDFTEQKPFQQTDALKITPSSDKVIKKTDELDKSSTSDSPHVDSKEISIKSKESDLTRVSVPQPAVAPLEEQNQAKDIPLEQKKETITSVLTQKESAPKAKPVTEVSSQQEKAPLHPEAVISKNGAKTTSPAIDEIKEKGEPEKPSTIVPTKDILPEKKAAEIQPQPVTSEKEAKPSLSTAETKELKQETTGTAESALSITGEKQTIPQHTEESPKRDSSVFQVISNDKTVPEIQRAIEKEESGAKDSHKPPKEKEKPISFISNFAGESTREISDTPGKVKTETPKFQPLKDEKILDKPSLSMKDEKDSVTGAEKVPQDAILSTSIKKETQMTSEKGEKPLSVTDIPKKTTPLDEMKPESIKKEEIPPSEAKVPDKKTIKTEEIISLPSKAPPSEKESTKIVSEPTKEKVVDVLKEKDVTLPTTISGPAKEPVTLETQSKDKKDSETLKPEKDTTKETTVIKASVDTSKVTEVPLYSLDMSDEMKVKESLVKSEEVKQPETKQPSAYSVDKDSTLQHKRAESIVSKDSVIQRSETDIKETEPKKELPSIAKDQRESILEGKPIKPPEKLIDSTVRKEKDISIEPSKPISPAPAKEEISKLEAPKEKVLPEISTTIIPEPSVKASPEVSSLASRGEDICITADKIVSKLVPSETQEESKNDGAKEVKHDEERPKQVPKEIVQEKPISDDDKLDKETKRIDQSSIDKGDVGKKEIIIDEKTTKSDEDTKEKSVDDRKTLPIAVNGLVPHLGGGEKVELPESKEDKLGEQDLQKTEDKLKETLKETSEIIVDSTAAAEPQDISDEQKRGEGIEEAREVSDSKDSQEETVIDKTTQEVVTDVEETMDTKAVEVKDSVEKDEQIESVVDTSDKLKEGAVSPKKKKLVAKSDETKGIRSVSPHKENGQARKKIHKRSESRDKAEISTIPAKQDNKESEKEENEEEKPAQKSPKRRRLRRAHRSAEERDTSSVPDSAKVPASPVKKPSTAPTQKGGLSSPKKTPYSRNGLLSPTKSLKGDKKLPPIKAAVGFAPNPNLKNIKSKIGSFDNIHYKPKGGDKKVITAKKLEWNASPKVKSLENTNYRPGGGDKKIITQKLDFKEKAQAKIEATKGERKKDSNEDDAPTTEAQESKEPDSVDATGETSEDQEVTA